MRVSFAMRCWPTFNPTTIFAKTHTAGRLQACHLAVFAHSMPHGRCLSGSAGGFRGSEVLPASSGRKTLRCLTGDRIMPRKSCGNPNEIFECGCRMVPRIRRMNVTEAASGKYSYGQCPEAEGLRFPLQFRQGHTQFWPGRSGISGRDDLAMARLRFYEK